MDVTQPLPHAYTHARTHARVDGLVVAHLAAWSSCVFRTAIAQLLLLHAVLFAVLQIAKECVPQKGCCTHFFAFASPPFTPAHDRSSRGCRPFPFLILRCTTHAGRNTEQIPALLAPGWLGKYAYGFRTRHRSRGGLVSLVRCTGDTLALVWWEHNGDMHCAGWVCRCCNALTLGGGWTIVFKFVCQKECGQFKCQSVD